MCETNQQYSIFDLLFYYYLVSYNTTGVLHSSDKMTECEFMLDLRGTNGKFF